MTTGKAGPRLRRGSLPESHPFSKEIHTRAKRVRHLPSGWTVPPWLRVAQAQRARECTFGTLLMRQVSCGVGLCTEAWILYLDGGLCLPAWLGPHKIGSQAVPPFPAAEALHFVTLLAAASFSSAERSLFVTSSRRSLATFGKAVP